MPMAALLLPPCSLEAAGVNKNLKKETMNKRLSVFMLCFFLLPLCTNAYSQDITVPLKDDKIFYEQVDSVTGLSKDQLYTRAKLWMANAFASAKDVIQMDDKEAGLLVGKGHFNIHSTGLGSATWPCNFTISLTAKDGKYRVQLYNFTYGQANHSMESVYEAYKKGKMKKATGAMLKEMDAQALGIVKSINQQLTTNQADF